MRWSAALLCIALAWACATPAFADARAVHALMAARQAPFLVADKVAGRLYYADPATGRVEDAPALYGKVIADHFDPRLLDGRGAMPGITPAGSFRLKRYYSTHLRMEMLAFEEGRTMVLAMHKVYLGDPAERRQDRITGDALSRRITNGCINVLPETWDRWLARLPDGTELVVLPEADGR